MTKRPIKFERSNVCEERADLDHTALNNFTVSARGDKLTAYDCQHVTLVPIQYEIVRVVIYPSVSQTGGVHS